MHHHRHLHRIRTIPITTIPITTITISIINVLFRKGLVSTIAIVGVVVITTGCTVWMVKTLWHSWFKSSDNGDDDVDDHGDGDGDGDGPTSPETYKTLLIAALSVVLAGFTIVSILILRKTH